MTALTLPAHSLLTGDRVCIGGHWHTVGRVTVENQEPQGAIVHIVLDHGTDQADLDADAEFEVQRPVTLGKRPDGSIGVNLDEIRNQLAAGMSVADARHAAALILDACDDADTLNGTEAEPMPGIPDTVAALTRPLTDNWDEPLPDGAL